MLDTIKITLTVCANLTVRNSRKPNKTNVLHTANVRSCDKTTTETDKFCTKATVCKLEEMRFNQLYIYMALKI